MLAVVRGGGLEAGKSPGVTGGTPWDWLSRAFSLGGSTNPLSSAWAPIVLIGGGPEGLD